MKKLLIIFLVLLFMLGCKTPVKNKIVPVSGKITFANGFNIPEGTKIVINPVEGQVQTASAIVDAQGNFKFVHATGKEGAELGNYIMVLYPPDFSVVPKYYTEEGLGKLEVTENTPALDLKITGYLKKK